MGLTQEGEVFQIRVVEGPAALRGQLVPSTGLIGRALPAPGGKWGGEQRVKTTYYPGNPVATQQVLGPTEKPLLIGGKWHDRFLGNGFAKALADIFDNLRRSGALLEVSWGTTAVPVTRTQSAAQAAAKGLPGGATTLAALQITGAPFVRRGILRRFEFSPNRSIEDIEWEMEFEWRGRDDAAAPINLSLPVGSIQDLTDATKAAADSVKTSFTNPLTQILGASQAVQDTIDDSLNGMFSAVSQMNQCSAALAQQAEVPAELANRVIGACRLAVGSIQNILDVYDNVQFCAVDVRDNALSLLAAVDDVLTLKTTLRAAQEAAIDQANDMEARTVPDVIAEVQVSADTDLRELARRYYGDADLWWLIADYNDMAGSAVPALPTGPSDNPKVTIQVPRRGGQTWNAVMGTGA